MKRKLLYSVFLTALVGFISSSFAQSEGYVTMKTAQKKGEEVVIEVETQGTTADERSRFTVEGAKLKGRNSKTGMIEYIVTDEGGNITVRGKIEVLYCFFSNLTALDIRNAKDLQVLSCYENQISELDVTQNKQLRALTVSRNKIKSIDLSKNGRLEHFAADRNLLTELDLTNNPNLGSFSCEENKIKSLDLSENERLQTLRCSNNELTALDLSANEYLNELCCSRNKLKGAELDKLIESLPDHSANEEGKGLFGIIDKRTTPDDENVCTVDQVARLAERGWIASERIGDFDWMPYPGSPGAVEEVLAEEQADIVEIYSLDGTKLSRLQQGVNIVRLSNGKVRKVISSL